jgi:hypothetical protein
LVKGGKAKVVGAIYDMHTGKVNWLPVEKVSAILKEADASPEKAINAMFEQNTPTQDKAAGHNAAASNDDQSLAPRVKDLAAKLDSKTAEAASELKEVRSKLDSLAGQVKNLTDSGKGIATDAGSETSKTLAADLKTIKAGMETRFSVFESSTNWMFWMLVSLLTLSVLCFSWLFWKLGNLGAQQEMLRGKVRKAFERINSDIKRMGG